MSFDTTSRAAAPKPPPIFEFTKRKKWADILISELSGSVLFILNPTADILWVSPAISELLGWHDQELPQRPIRYILHDDDIAPFIKHFNHAINTGTELFTYSRLRSKIGSPSGDPGLPTGMSHSAPPTPTGLNTTTLLFELRGYSVYSKLTPDSVGVESSSRFMPNLEPNLDAEPEASCFVIMARPYSSPNTTMLDSFLELKIENERLRQQLLNLRTLSPSASPQLASLTYPVGQISSASNTPLAQSSSKLGSPIYHANSSPINLGRTMTSGDADAAYQPHTIHAMPRPPAATDVYYPIQTHRPGRKSSDAMFPFNSNRPGPSGGWSGAPSPVMQASTAEVAAIEPPENRRPRKKPRRAHVAHEQYVCVTCGRTDSPEWRKGPLGAKTLCNACGLSWAKRNSKRKTDEFGRDISGGG